MLYCLLTSKEPNKHTQVWGTSSERNTGGRATLGRVVREGFSVEVAFSTGRLEETKPAMEGAGLGE